MDSKKKAVIKACAIEKKYFQGGKELDVLQGVNALFEQGHSYAITGVSGSGKSTLLHILGGLDTATSGTVFFNDRDLSGMSNKAELLNQQIGFVFQFHYLVKELTVLENVMMMGLIKKEPPQICRTRALELLEMTGIQHRADFYPGQLSGGEQQRVSVVRALFNKPAFLLADEPTGNLDAQRAQDVVKIFKHAQQEWGMGIILCSHDEAVYSQMQTLMRLHRGILK